MHTVFITVSCVLDILLLRGMCGIRLLWSNAVIAAAAAGCVLRSWCMAHHADSTAAVPLIFAAGIGAATWIAYTWQRHVKSTRPRGLRDDHRQWLSAHKRAVRWVAFFLAPLAMFPLAQTAAAATATWPTALLLLAGLVVAGLLTLLYAGLPGVRGVQLALRRLPRLKLLWIGLAWAIITALWPILLDSNSNPLNQVNLLLMIGERALVIMALTLPFDLRDRSWDPAFMKTWPQQWGTRGTRVAAVVMLLAAALASTIATEGNLAFGLGPLLMAPLVACAREQRPPWYYLLLDAALIADGAWVVAFS